jgi:hypothetical protein
MALALPYSLFGSVLYCSKACAMLKHTLEWRKENKIGGLLLVFVFHIKRRAAVSLLLLLHMV